MFTTGSYICYVLGDSRSERQAAVKVANGLVVPTPDKRIFESAGVRPEVLTYSEGQPIVDADSEDLRNIKGG
jgi:hypothetical protein